MNRTMPSLSDRLDMAIEEECAEIRKHPTSPDWRLCRRNQTWIVADLLIHSRDYAAAARAACEMASECSDHWQECYDAACLMARCVALVLNDETLTAKDRSRLTRSYSSQAIRFLKSASDKGFQDFARLSKDPDLTPLRNYHGFKTLTSTVRAGVRSDE
jgi:hypothetical protein